MTSEFDHVFICVSAGGEEASTLGAFGLTEGTPNAHPGQGTACRRFFFANSYLELLWVANAAEAQSEAIRPTHLWERWAGRGGDACSIGLGFRPGVPRDDVAPFNSWDYRPPYLPAPLSIRVATNAAVLTEPMLFYLPFGKRPDNYPDAQRSMFTHRAGLREVTRVGITSPHTEAVSPEMLVVTTKGLTQLRAGPEYLVELGFDGEPQGRQADFRPQLPVILRW